MVRDGHAKNDAQFGALEHAPTPAFVYEVRLDEYILVFVNALARTLNPEIVAFVGKPMGALYSDQPELQADARRALVEGISISREVVVRRHDHTRAVVSVRLTWAPVSPNHVVVFTQPATEGHRPDAALRESEARYRGLFASLPDAVLLRSADGRVLACNEVAARLWKSVGASELVGRTEILVDGIRVRDEQGSVVTEEELPSIVAVRTGQPQGPVEYEVEINQMRRWCRLAAQPVFAPDGTVTASVSVMTDITDRVEAEHQLRAAVARLDLALDAGRMGVWEYDAACNAGWWSENLYSVFALNVPPGGGIESFGALVHPDDVQGYLSAVRTFIARNDNGLFEAEFRILGSDGVARWARVQGRRVAEPLRYAGTIVDVTERRRLEEELRRAHRLESIGRLAGGVAHDFNNLLAAMMGAVELLEEGRSSSALDEVTTIRHAVLRARDLTKQLLAFAKKQPIEFRTVELGEMVTTVERLVRRLVGPEIEIVLSLEQPVFVRADPASLEQVILNLVVNARDAMAGGGRLEIRVYREVREAPDGSARAVIAVSDTGAGMDDSTRSHLFDPFFTTKVDGTGLGLPSSYGIVQQHGGDIAVETQKGSGTTFRVLLPLAPTDLQTADAAPAANASAKREGRVLVVDDEELVRSVVVRLLRSLGYQVLAAGSAVEALEIVHGLSQPVDILLCDVAMPVRDGISLATELLELLPNLRVIFASGYTENVLPEGMKRCGFIAKPYRRSELVVKLDEALRA